MSRIAYTTTTCSSIELSAFLSTSSVIVTHHTYLMPITVYAPDTWNLLGRWRSVTLIVSPPTIGRDIKRCCGPSVRLCVPCP